MPGLVLFGRLDPLRAAVLFVAAELVTLATAQLLLAKLVEPLSVLRYAWKPIVAAGGGWALGRTFAANSPVLLATMILVAAAIGMWTTEPALVRRLLRLRR